MGRTQDFTNSVIYHIRHMESKEVVYVGSTTNFSQRKGAHKHYWNKEGKNFTSPIYCHIRDNGGFECFEVIPIKSLKLRNKTELLIAEQEEMDKHRTLANRNKAHMTIEEHKEYQKQYTKQYHEEHKAERNQNAKLYYQEHKAEHKKYEKKYREEHKAEIKQYKKLYYQEHKENINESIKCTICNSTVTRGSLKRHQRSKKCQEYLNK